MTFYTGEDWQKHRGSALTSARTKATHNKTVKEAMELQVAGRGGSKRKYALADIKADILLVSKE
jgi:hypothetical protein